MSVLFTNNCPINSFSVVNNIVVEIGVTTSSWLFILACYFNGFYLLSILTSCTYTKYDIVSGNLHFPLKGNHQNLRLYFDYIKKSVILRTNRNDAMILLYHIT